MQLNSVELSFLEMVKIDRAAELMGRTVEGLLREGAAGQRLLYCALSPYDATLSAIPSHEAPRQAQRSSRTRTFVALTPDSCVELALQGVVEIKHWPAAMDDDDSLVWHYWHLEKPQQVALEMVFVPEWDVSLAPVNAQLSTAGASASERNKLLRHIGGLAMLLAEVHGTYKRGETPNREKIASEVVELLAAMPDANTFGAGNTSIRTSIAEGIKLLKS